MTIRKVLGPDDTTEADDRIVRVEHWPAGQVKKVTQADGTSTIYTYDTAQRLVRVADNAGNAIEYTLDGSSNRVREDTRESTGELRQQLARTYDLLGNLRTEVDAYQHATTYVTDAAGRVDTVTNALNRVSDDDYDLLGRRVRSIHDRDGIASQSRYEYDIFDRVTRVVDPKDLSTSYTYDAFGNVTRLESPDTGVTINAYDIAGNRSRSVDANGKIIDYRYDVLNRLKTVDYAAAVPDQTYAYDVTMADCPAGENFGGARKTRCLDESGYTNFCYNRFGDLVRKIQRTGNSTLIMRWQYAANGRLLKEIRPGNVEIDYGYDAVGRITEIGVNHGTGRAVLLSGASYYPFGPAAQWTYGNGRGMTRELDLNYDVRRIVSTGVDGLDYAFDVDEVGNLVELRHASTNALLRTYGYDGLDRLSSERIGGSSSLLREYTYDKTGNRTATSRLVAVDGDSTYQTVWFNNSYASDSHRLIHDGTDPRDYDDAGNLTRVGAPSSAHSTFSYNEGNRLSAISRGTTAAVYAYNAVGERVRRSVNGIDTLSLYDASGQWIADYDGQGVSAQQVIWLGNLPVGVVVGYGASSKLYYVEPDALGTPRAVVDPTRDVAVWRWPLESEAFGADAPDPDADADGVAFTFDMRFPGQRFDAASGLNYNYYRDYESSTGRYVESDPIGLSGGLSTYSYVSSKPLESTDPFGQRGRRGTPHDDDWLKSARNDAISALDNCNMKDCDPANPYAISQQQLDEIKQKVKSADIKFDGDNKDCGESMPNDQPNLIRIGRAMISGGNCCSVASVVAHEATHLVLGHTAYENLNQIIEGKALFVQLKCFGCSNWYNYHASK
jgi:RHS repeat-associated protein